MEKINSIERGIEMKKYIKPSVININNAYNIIPLAAGVAAVAGLSAAGAFAYGVAKGLEGDDKNNISLNALPKCI